MNSEISIRSTDPCRYSGAAQEMAVRIRESLLSHGYEIDTLPHHIIPDQPGPDFELWSNDDGEGRTEISDWVTPCLIGGAPAVSKLLGIPVLCQDEDIYL